MKLRDLTLHRDGATVDRVQLRDRTPALRCRLATTPRPGRPAEAALALLEDFAGAAPGQLACLMAGELIVGHATIAA
ncbi:MAG: hypothetical protein NVSMB49_29370 [Ktedonobacteraceae bacterium]